MTVRLDRIGTSACVVARSISRATRIPAPTHLSRSEAITDADD
jgi:hypothetical protein